ncbi:MAG: hypothetical protein MSG64_15760 [Pyrinomonadaceae bacterium MAG19_C2-C3]|nr:hypothetical protein [Pyrinomonadaceae bacterium MAG19_C2-C3]
MAIFRQVLAALVRWVMFSIGLELVRRSVIPQELFDKVMESSVVLYIVGALMLILPLAWKAIEAWISRKLYNVALTAPPNTPSALIRREVWEDVKTILTPTPKTNPYDFKGKQ